MRVSNQFPFIQNTTSSGLASDYDLIRNSLTLDHQGDDDSEPPHQLASNESQPLKSVEQEIVELRNENAALKATNTALETENNTLRYTINETPITPSDILNF